mgnify:CR=1 FL=1
MPTAKLPTLSLAAQLRDPVTRPATIAGIASECREGVTGGAIALGLPLRTLWRWRAEDAELRHAIDRARGLLAPTA